MTNSQAIEILQAASKDNPMSRETGEAVINLIFALHSQETKDTILGCWIHSGVCKYRELF